MRLRVPALLRARSPVMLALFRERGDRIDERFDRSLRVADRYSSDEIEVVGQVELDVVAFAQDAVGIVAGEAELSHMDDDARLIVTRHARPADVVCSHAVDTGYRVESCPR